MMKYPILKSHLESWIALAVIILVESERPKFRDDYRYEKGFDAFYKVHYTAAPWWQARARCAAEGAALLTPANLDEADAMPLLIATILNNYEGVFIGIHDFYAERVFVTMDGAPMLDSILNLLWEHKEPRHGAGRCLAMHHNGRILVHPCEKPLPYICKVKASAIKRYEQCNTFDPRWELGPNSTCYFIHTEPQSWFNAFGTCLAAGGHLAVMNSRREAEHVRAMFKRVPKRRVPDDDFAFLGFNDLFQRYHFRTIQGRRLDESGYADWTIECGRAANSSCGEERCGGLRRSALLALARCDVPAMFICEKTTGSVLETSEESDEAQAEETTTQNTKTKKGKGRMGAQDSAASNVTIAIDALHSAPSTTSNNTNITSKNTPASEKSLTARETSLSLSKNTRTTPSLATTRPILNNETLYATLTTGLQNRYVEDIEAY